jgi:hypothetical protein
LVDAWHWVQVDVAPSAACARAASAQSAASPIAAAAAFTLRIGPLRTVQGGHFGHAQREINPAIQGEFPRTARNLDKHNHPHRTHALGLSLFTLILRTMRSMTPTE